MKKIFILFSTFFFCEHLASCQTIPASRVVDWSLAGMRDTMPDFQNVLNLRDFGAHADGVTPDDTAFQAALNALNGSAGVLYFPAGNYTFRQNLTLRDSLLLRGAGADSTFLKFIAPVSGDLVRISGSAGTEQSFLLFDAAKEDTCIIVDSAFHFTAGDYIKLTFNDSALVTSSWAYQSVGQIIRIKMVNGDTLFLASPLRWDYPVSAQPKIIKINPVSFAGVECLKITRAANDIFQSSNIHFQYAANCRLWGVESDTCNFAHVEISNSTNIQISNAYFHDAFDFGGGGKAYGVMIHFTSGECLVENNIFRRLRHAMILQAGANGNVFGYNYSIEPYWTGVSLPANSAGDMVLHGNFAYGNLFEGNIGQNIVIDDSHGSNGLYNTFFRNRAELFGIFMNNAPPSDRQNFVGNEITHSTFPYGLYFINGTGHFEYGNNVNGTITPANTGTLPDVSYYLDRKPSFLFDSLPFPAIGIPHAIGSGSNRAAFNYSDNIYAYCDTAETDTLDTSISDIISSNNDIRIKVFPNPASGVFQIEIAGDEFFVVEIINSLGVKIESRMVNHRSTIPAAYPPGMYYLIFRGGKGTVVCKQLMIY